jgi:hypothetical protein
MHGSLLHGFKEFVRRRYGEAAWSSVVEAAGAGGWYHSTQTYPDEELVALVNATAVREKQPVASVLEDFGAALVPVLMSLYKAFAEPQWRTLELLANSESVIHRTVRLRDPDAHPPQLKPRWISDREVQIEYRSARRLCAVAVGICRGVADYYGDTVSVQQTACMERQDGACLILVRLTPD